MEEVTNKNNFDETIGPLILVVGGVRGVFEGSFFLSNPNWRSQLSTVWQASINNIISTPIVGEILRLLLSFPSFMIFAGVIFIAIGCMWAVINWRRR